MHILNILPYSPCPPHFGGALRIFHLLKEMVRRHEVTVVMYGTPREGDDVREAFDGQLRGVHCVEKPLRASGLHKRLAQVRSLAQSGSATTHAFHSARMQAMIDAVVAEDSFDLIQLENHPTGLFRIDLPGVPRILDVQNVEYDNVRRMSHATTSALRRVYYAREYRKLRREESGVYAAQDAILVTSTRDRSLVDADVPRIPKFVIPNGVDASFFSPTEAPVEPHSLVFTGAMNYFPNADAMVYFLKEIFPLILKEIPDTRVSFVGGGPSRQPEALASANVEITGYVPDVRPHVHRAAVYIVPLRMGGGTRLKVLEAMAMEKPVVTTSVGCEGIAGKDRETALVADDPERFASSVVQLMRDRELCTRIVRRGRDLVLAEYEWSKCPGTSSERSTTGLNPGTGNRDGKDRHTRSRRGESMRGPR